MTAVRKSGSAHKTPAEAPARARLITAASADGLPVRTGRHFPFSRPDSAAIFAFPFRTDALYLFFGAETTVCPYSRPAGIALFGPASAASSRLPRPVGRCSCFPPPGGRASLYFSAPAAAPHFPRCVRHGFPAFPAGRGTSALRLP